MKSKRHHSYSQKRVGVVAAEGGRGEPPNRLEQFIASCCSCCWSRRRRRCTLPSTSTLRSVPSQIGRRLRDCFSNVSSLRAVITLMCVTMIIVAGGVALGVSLTYTLSAAEDYAIRFVTSISEKGKQKFEDFIDIPLRKAISYQYAVEQGRFPLPINKTIAQRATDFNFWLDTFYTAFNETDNQLMFFSLGMQDESYFDCYSDVYPVIVCRIRDSVNLTNISTTPAGSFAKSFYVKRVDLRSGAVLSEQWSSTTYTPLARPWYWQVNHTHGAKSWTRVSLESTNLVPIIDINAACFSPVGFSGPGAGQTFSGVFSFSFRLAFLSVYLAELQRTKGAHILLVDNDDFLLATTISANLLPIAHYVNYSAMSLQTITQADKDQNGGPINATSQPFRENAFGVSAGGGGASVDGRTTAPRLTPAGACTAVARLSAWYCREHVDTYGVTYFADMKRKINTAKDYAPQKIRLRGSNFFVNNISYLHKLGQYLGALAVTQPTMVNLSNTESLATAATVARGGSGGNNDAVLQRAGYPTASQPTATDDFYASVTAVRSLSGAENMYWRVLTLIPESDITEKIIEGRNYAIYVVTGVVVVCMVLALVGTWALLRPLREMATLMYAASTFQRNGAGGGKARDRKKAHRHTSGEEEDNDDENDQNEKKRREEDLEADAVIRNPSALVELKQLQLAFITLSDQITRARQYLPATLLQGPDATAGSCDGGATPRRRQSSAYSRDSSQSNTNHGGDFCSESGGGYSEGDLEDDINDNDDDEFGCSRNSDGDLGGGGHPRHRRHFLTRHHLTGRAGLGDSVSASTDREPSTATDAAAAAASEGGGGGGKSAAETAVVAMADATTVKSFLSSIHNASATPSASVTPSVRSASSASSSSCSDFASNTCNGQRHREAASRTRHRRRLDQLASINVSNNATGVSVVEKRRSRLFLMQQQQQVSSASSQLPPVLPLPAPVAWPGSPAGAAPTNGTAKNLPQKAAVGGVNDTTSIAATAVKERKRKGDAKQVKNKDKTMATTVAALRSDLGLVRRRVTVLYLNVSDFQHPALAAFGGVAGGTSAAGATSDSYSYSWFGHMSRRNNKSSNLRNTSDDELFVKQFSRLVTAVSAAAEGARGVLDSFHGDRFVVTFNAARPCASHAVSAVTAAKKLLEQQGPRRCDPAIRTASNGAAHLDPRQCPPPCRLRCGVATGVAVVGNLGSDNTRRFCTIGPVYGHAALLERLCLYYSKRSRSSGVEVPLLMSEATLVDAETVHPVLYVDAIPRPLPQSTQGPYRAAHAEAVRKAATEWQRSAQGPPPDTTTTTMMTTTSKIGSLLASGIVGRCLPLVPLTLIGTLILPDDDVAEEGGRDSISRDDAASACDPHPRNPHHQRNDRHSDQASRGGGGFANSRRGQRGLTPQQHRAQAPTTADDEWMYEIEEASSAARPENALNDIFSLCLRERNQYVLRYNRVWLEAMLLIGTEIGMVDRASTVTTEAYTDDERRHAHDHLAIPGRNEEKMGTQEAVEDENDEKRTPPSHGTQLTQQYQWQQHYDLLRNALAAAESFAAETAIKTTASIQQVYNALPPPSSLSSETTTGIMTHRKKLQQEIKEHQQTQPPQQPSMAAMFTLSHLPRMRIAPLFHKIAADMWRSTALSRGSSPGEGGDADDDPQLLKPRHRPAVDMDPFEEDADPQQLDGIIDVPLSLLFAAIKRMMALPTASSSSSLSLSFAATSPHSPHDDDVPNQQQTSKSALRNPAAVGTTLRGFSFGSYFEDCLLKPF